EEGADLITVTITPAAGGTAVTVTSTAIVLGAPLSAGSLQVPPFVEGQSNTLVASFTDADPAATAQDFSAWVDWGDGHESAGAVSGSAASFTVPASHLYVEENAPAPAYPLAITVVDGGKSKLIITGSAAVADAPLVLFPAQSVPVETAGE